MSILGIDGKIFVDTNASPVWATPTWTEFTLVRSVTLSMDKATTDVTTRGGSGWRQTRGTLKDGSVDIEILYDPSDTVFEHIRSQFFTNGQVLAAVFDGEIVAGSIPTGTTRYGLKAWYDVIDFSIPQELEGVFIVNASIRVTDSSATEDPTWLSVAGTG